MGQQVQVEHVLLGDVAIFDTDRSLSGQEGETFSVAEEAAAADTFPARLAADLFAARPEIRSVYVYSNTASVRGPGGWSEEQARQMEDVIRNCLVHYDQNRR